MKDFESNNDTFFEVGKETPFTVPEGYFDELPTRIQDFCLAHAPATSGEPERSFLGVLKAQLALASGFIALVFLAFAGYYYIQPKPPVDGLSNGDFIEIVRIDVSDFDEAQLNSLQESKSPYDTLANDSTDEMIQYLLEENVDYVTLMEQY